MLISLEYGFVFIAGTKTASTSIEQALRSYCEVTLAQTPFGKHENLAYVLDFLAPLLCKAQKPLLVVGVIRNPLSRLQSLYRSHMAEGFSDRPELSTRNLTFEEFLGDWCTTHQSQAAVLGNMYYDLAGGFAADYLIDFDRLDEGFVDVCRLIGLDCPPELPKVNESPEVAGLEHVSAAVSASILGEYWFDQWLGDRFTNRLLSFGDRQEIESERESRRAAGVELPRSLIQDAGA